MSLKRGGHEETATNLRQKHSYYTSLGMAQAEFEQWCVRNCVTVPALVPDVWVRTNSPGKRPTNKSLAVIQKPDCIIVHDHTVGNTDLFSGRPESMAGRMKRRIVLKRQRDADEKRKQARYVVAAGEALNAWQEATDAPVSGYMAKKQLTSTHGARWHRRRNCWLVPVTDVHGNLYSVQRIYNKPSPNKFCWPGARTAGCLVFIGVLEMESRVIVCEGFATGATLRQETDEVIVCALFAGNLMAVCKAIREAYSDIAIIVAGDDDRCTDGNPGRTNAIEAARTVNGKTAFPKFCDGCASCTDFNDAVTCNDRQKLAR